MLVPPTASLDPLTRRDPRCLDPRRVAFARLRPKRRHKREVEGEGHRLWEQPRSWEARFLPGKTRQPRVHLCGPADPTPSEGLGFASAVPVSCGRGLCSVFWKQTCFCALPHPHSLPGVPCLPQDLHQRLDGTRLTPPLEDSRFHYGFNSNYLKKVLSYWRNEFDWRKQVETLNRYPHFKTKIEGMFPEHQLGGVVGLQSRLSRCRLGRRPSSESNFWALGVFAG